MTTVQLSRDIPYRQFAHSRFRLATRTVMLALVFVFLVNAAELAAAATGSQVERGEYLAAAGDCVSCHTREDGQPFAGGVRFVTPFGTIYSTNITSDPKTGIGQWTEQEFSDALRKGVGPNGEHLYPVFPYTAFTKISDEDTAALFAYLQTLSPVEFTPPANDLSFPFNQRWLMGVWKAMYFEQGRFVPNEAQSAEWNRGAYLVQGLGHCGMCHTPRNFLGALDNDLAMTGGTYLDKVEGMYSNWSAVNLTSAPSGLDLWSVDDIVSYLKLGVSERAGVFGPMNEVIVNSTRHMSVADLQAMATYLKSLPANMQDHDAPADEETLRAGSLQYDIHCGTCHLPTGLGSDSTGPPLVGSPVALAADPASLINITLFGAQLPEIAPSQEWQSRDWQLMEPFADKLNNEDAAALLSYVRSAWGNEAGAVTAEQVAAQREDALE